MATETDQNTYHAAGVDTAAEQAALQDAFRRLPIMRSGMGAVQLKNGFFANVIAITPHDGIAISTDGVGTKILIAEHLRKYDTIGIDCIAMNANDIICVGAEPLALVDYLGVHHLDPEVVSQLMEGLARGAEIAGITIPGGETAQVPDMVAAPQGGMGFDFAGTCIGHVALDRIVDGRDIATGDALLGLLSSGIHSNGLSLARRILLGAPDALRRFEPSLGRTLGEELLVPTRIYVREVMRLLRSGLRVTGLAHMTSDGFLNLDRFDSPHGFVIDALPPVPPIFSLIQERGGVCAPEMFTTFNMGIGFCVVVREADADAALRVLNAEGPCAMRIGRAVAADRKTIAVPAAGLTGRDGRFVEA